MTAAMEALILCEKYFPWRLKPVPETVVPKNEQAENDLSGEHETEDYQGGGYELPRHERAMVEHEN